jgi:hypothetical protein
MGVGRSVRRLDEKTSGGSWQGAKGGEVVVDCPGQQILERTVVVLNRAPAGEGSNGSGNGGAVESIEVRVCVNLPAQGRSVMGR